MIWARLDTEQSRAARRHLEQQRQQRALRHSQQQHAGQCQQQYWLPLCEGDLRGRTVNRTLFERAECASPRTSAVSRTKAHQTRPVSRRTSAGNEYAVGAGAGNACENECECPRASAFEEPNENGSKN